MTTITNEKMFSFAYEILNKIMSKEFFLKNHFEGYWNVKIMDEIGIFLLKLTKTLLDEDF